MAVTIADCVPVFMADRSGGVAVLHSGWKGTEAGIVVRAIDLFRARGAQPADLLIHLGPAVCGRCYVVSPDVFVRLTGRAVAEPAPADLRELIASQARSHGVREISISPWCTRCHNERFFSHRAGDEGRQLGVIALHRNG
jgi:YfiH family protein